MSSSIHNCIYHQHYLHIKTKMVIYSLSFRSITDYKHIDKKHLSYSLHPQWPHSIVESYMARQNTVIR